MVYLFWAFVVVWLGLSACLYRLVRRSQVLERQVADLADRDRRGDLSEPARAGEARPSGAAKPAAIGVDE